MKVMVVNSNFFVEVDIMGAGKQNDFFRLFMIPISDSQFYLFQRCVTGEVAIKQFLGEVGLVDKEKIQLNPEPLVVNTPTEGIYLPILLPTG